jgi:hypothetical protein
MASDHPQIRYSVYSCAEVAESVYGGPPECFSQGKSVSALAGPVVMLLCSYAFSEHCHADTGKRSWYMVLGEPGSDLHRYRSVRSKTPAVGLAEHLPTGAHCDLTESSLL